MRILGNRVLVRPEASKQEGAVFVLERMRPKPMMGRVVAVGSRGGFVVKVGDRVIFDRYQNATFMVGGVGHVLCREADIFALVGG